MPNRPVVVPEPPDFYLLLTLDCPVCTHDVVVTNITSPQGGRTTHSVTCDSCDYQFSIRVEDQS